MDHLWMFITYLLIYGNYSYVNWTGPWQHHFKVCGGLAQCGVNSRMWSSSKCSLDSLVRLGTAWYWSFLISDIFRFLEMFSVGSMNLLGFASHWFFIFAHFIFILYSFYVIPLYIFYSAIGTGLLSGLRVAVSWSLCIDCIASQSTFSLRCLSLLQKVDTLAPTPFSLTTDAVRTVRCYNRAQEAGGSLAWRQVGKLLCEEWRFMEASSVFWCRQCRPNVGLR